MQSAIHPEVRFARVPPLWPETYTDLYKIDLSADAEEVNEAIETVTRHVEDAYYHYDENFRLFYTDAQYLVDDLREALYGMEIAYQHNHFPNSTPNG